jgi:hypothetical protein
LTTDVHERLHATLPASRCPPPTAAARSAGPKQRGEDQVGGDLGQVDLVEMAKDELIDGLGLLVGHRRSPGSP